MNEQFSNGLEKGGSELTAFEKFRPSRMDLEELRDQIKQDRLSHLITLVMLLVGFISLDIIWYVELRRIHTYANQLYESSKQLQGAINEYSTNIGPKLIQFVHDLQEYSKKDPKFAELLNRYPRFTWESETVKTNQSSGFNK